ncbi:MAG TPA: hypothetical protein VHS09_04510 [Polyangiaceae bacterium]|jgi:hypothetical protein|nr:hypothetical protein [Polyangiaceae bacterium]
MPDRDELVAAWSAKDRTRAVLPADRALVDASATIRALIVDLVLAGGPEDELYDACAVLGRLVAQRGGSPTLASATLDHAADVLDARSAPWLVPGRAAVSEGFAATLVEAAQLEAMRTWEFPSCAVPLGQAALAICAGHPSDDDEVLAAWAARVANAAALAGVRRAVLSGGERASAALVDALSVVGIEVNAAPKPR